MQKHQQQAHIHSQPSQHNVLELSSKLKLQRITEVIDYQYDHFGTKIAASDSQGNVVIYAKEGDKFVFHSEFKGSNSSIWKISWAHPKFGDLIAIGSFSKKVGVFQLKNNEWIEIVSHELHEASVNEVIWAPYYFGLKLFACSSDGSFSLLQIRDGAWVMRLTKAHQLSINSICIEKRSILENYQNYEQTYPNVITASKDKTLSLWIYEQGEYRQKLVQVIHKQPIRKILWREPSYRQSSVEIFSCSDDGTLKYITIKNNQFHQKTLLSENNPIVKISQSLLGDILIASFERSDSNISLVLKDEEGQWMPVEQLESQ